MIRGGSGRGSKTCPGFATQDFCCWLFFVWRQDEHTNSDMLRVKVQFDTSYQYFLAVPSNMFSFAVV